MHSSDNIAPIYKERSICLGYGFDWKGPLNPIIRDIKLVDSRGKVIQELEEEKDTLIYINNGHPIGSMWAEDVN